MKSWKIGAIAGLIAGIIAGIVNFYFALFLFEVELPYWLIPAPPETSMIKIALVEVAVNMMWGAFLGIIFSKIYDLIPGKGILKGFYFGFLYWIFYFGRGIFLCLAYAYYTSAVAWTIYFFIPIIYGIILGILYRIFYSGYSDSQDKWNSNKKNMKSGILPGIIAGILGGMAAIIPNIMVVNPDWPEMVPKLFIDIYFLINQFATDVFIHFIWGAIYGAFYALFYNRIPGKGVTKGIFYGLLIYLLSPFRYASYNFAYGILFFAKQWTITPFIVFTIFGIIIGYLYKPSK
ncbi:hypothetical protein [[Eubacterium] cellulosolvens]